MSAPHEIRCQKYVERPYASVRAALTRDPAGFFGRTKMKIDIAGVAIDPHVAVDVRVEPTTKPPAALALPAIALAIHWEATKPSSLFPSMKAELTVYPLSDDETELDLHGWYTPPGGAVGSAADTLVGHRVAEAALRDFLDDVCARLQGGAL